MKLDYNYVYALEVVCAVIISGIYILFDILKDKIEDKKYRNKEENLKYKKP